MKYTEQEDAEFRAQMEEEERRRAATVQADLRQMAEQGEYTGDDDGPADAREAGGGGEDHSGEFPENYQNLSVSRGDTPDDRTEDPIREDRSVHGNLSAEEEEEEDDYQEYRKKRQQEENVRSRSSRENGRRDPQRSSDREDERRDSRERKEQEDRKRRLDRREKDQDRREKELGKRERAQKRREAENDRDRRRDYAQDEYNEPEMNAGRRGRSSADYDPEDLEEMDSRQRRGEGRRKKKKNPAVRFLSVLLVILLIGFVFLIGIYYRLHGSLSINEVKEKIAQEVSSDQTLTGYTNIALFGVDSIEESLSSGNNRSDVMIILSINNATKEAKLVSVYRDTYLDIGSGTYTKANAAYAYGGPTQAVTMLNQNFDLDIEDYATIGFGGVADIIDSLGGIDIEIKQEEISFMNDYQSTMAQELGKEYVPVTAAGTQTLTGLQAVSYCRVRYTSGGDFTRTERQRTVLTKTFEKLKSASPSQMLSIASKLLGNGEVQTSLSMTELATLAAGASGYSISDSTGVPTESLRTDAYVGKQDCIIPVTLADNVVWLHNYLFGEADYQVSSTVQSISDQIHTNTGY